MDFDELLKQVGLTREDMYYEADEEPIDEDVMRQGVLVIEALAEWDCYGSAPHSADEAIWEWMASKEVDEC